MPRFDSADLHRSASARAFVVPSSEGPSASPPRAWAASVDLRSAPARIALAPFLIATAVGLIVLWPSQPEAEDFGGRPLDPQFHATVVGIDRGACESPGNTGGPSLECSVVEIRLDTGPDEGKASVSRKPAARTSVA